MRAPVICMPILPRILHLTPGTVETARDSTAPLAADETSAA